MQLNVLINAAPPALEIHGPMSMREAASINNSASLAFIGTSHGATPSGRHGRPERRALQSLGLMRALREALSVLGPELAGLDALLSPEQASHTVDGRVAASVGRLAALLQDARFEQAPLLSGATYTVVLDPRADGAQEHTLTTPDIHALAFCEPPCAEAGVDYANERADLRQLVMLSLGNVQSLEATVVALCAQLERAMAKHIEQRGARAAGGGLQQRASTLFQTITAAGAQVLRAGAGAEAAALLDLNGGSSQRSG